MTTAVDNTSKVASETSRGNLLTFKEAQDYLRVSRSTLYRLIEGGQLTGHKVGSGWRFYFADVQACVRISSHSCNEDGAVDLSQK